MAISPISLAFEKSKKDVGIKYSQAKEKVTVKTNNKTGIILLTLRI